MASNSNKRARADSAGNATTLTTTTTTPAPTSLGEATKTQSQASPTRQYQDYEIVRWVKELDGETRDNLFINAALLHPDIAKSIKTEYDKKIAIDVAREKSEILSFNHYADQVQDWLNKTYSGLSLTKQYDKAVDVANEIEKVIRAIDDAVKVHHPFDTKENALETICLIFTRVVDSHNIIGREVQRHITSSWGQYLIQICTKFTKEEEKEFEAPRIYISALPGLDKWLQMSLEHTNIAQSLLEKLGIPWLRSRPFMIERLT